LRLLFHESPFDVINNPETATHEWLKQHFEFEIVKEIDDMLLISDVLGGCLRRKS
jgi:cephalosporin hydroxylase